MPAIKFERQLAIPAPRLFQIVDDPSVYPQVFNRITGVTDISRSNSSQGALTEMNVGLKFSILNGSVRVKTLTNQQTGLVRVNLVKGPFNLAHGVMQLRALQDGTSQILGQCKYETPLAVFAETIEKKFDILVNAVCDSLLHYDKSQEAGGIV